MFIANTFETELSLGAAISCSVQHCFPSLAYREQCEATSFWPGSTGMNACSLDFQDWKSSIPAHLNRTHRKHCHCARNTNSTPWKVKHFVGTLAIYANTSTSAFWPWPETHTHTLPHFHTKQLSVSLHRLRPDGNNEMSMKAFAV